MDFIESIIFWQASAQLLHTSAVILHDGIMSACIMHMSAQARHMVMQASNMAIMEVRSIPAGRIIARPMAPHMSAQFMCIDIIGIMCFIIMSSSGIMPAAMVQACSQAMHDSMHSCIICMSMPGIVPSSMSIISDVMFMSNLTSGPRLRAIPRCTTKPAVRL
ncbi:MAG: hypothetical protein ABF811_06945 [Pseudoclavibacter sp.]